MQAEPSCQRRRTKLEAEKQIILEGIKVGFPNKGECLFFVKEGGKKPLRNILYPLMLMYDKNALALICNLPFRDSPALVSSRKELTECLYTSFK